VAPLLAQKQIIVVNMKSDDRIRAYNLSHCNMYIVTHRDTIAVSKVDANKFEIQDSLRRHIEVDSFIDVLFVVQKRKFSIKLESKYLTDNRDVYQKLMLSLYYDKKYRRDVAYLKLINGISRPLFIDVVM
jgi:hypothetical protein